MAYETRLATFSLICLCLSLSRARFINSLSLALWQVRQSVHLEQGLRLTVVYLLLQAEQVFPLRTVLHTHLTYSSLVGSDSSGYCITEFSGMTLGKALRIRQTLRTVLFFSGN